MKHARNCGKLKLRAGWPTFRVAFTLPSGPLSSAMSLSSTSAIRCEAHDFLKQLDLICRIPGDQDVFEATHSIPPEERSFGRRVARGLHDRCWTGPLLLVRDTSTVSVVSRAYPLTVALSSRRGSKLFLSPF